MKQYGQPGDKKPGTYDADPTTPIGSWKTAWKNARTNAKVSCRFHDLRHSAVTRLLEGGVSFPADRESLRVESEHNHEDGEALRPHRQRRAS